MGQFETTKLNFSALTSEEWPIAGSFIFGFDTADDILKKIDSSGDYSHAGGFHSQASGITSFVHGYGSTSNGNGTVVLGNNITGTSVNTVYVQTLKLNPQTTLQKNSIVAENGMIVYDSTLNKFQGFENGVWVNLI